MGEESRERKRQGGRREEIHSECKGKRSHCSLKTGWKREEENNER
jgi:hypothetical protein